MKQMLPPSVGQAWRPPSQTPKRPTSRRRALLLDAAPTFFFHASEASQLAHAVDHSPVKDAGADSQTGTSPRVRRVTDRAVQVQIVEDLPRVQQLLRQLVEQPGRFEVTGIDDTEHEAFQRSQAQPPDALVVDLNLRQGSGLGLIHAVRKLYGASPTGPLIIVVTNHTMPVLEAACIKAGADHFLDKSRELPRLSALLGQAFFP